MFHLKGSQSSFYAVYNDEKPGVLTAVEKTLVGHLKGAVAFDNSSGLWIIHSIPKLSESPDQYQYPDTGRIYGQHMLCVTLSSAYMLPLIEQLVLSKPQFLATYVSEDWTEKYPEIEALFNDRPKTNETSKIAPFETVDGNLKMRHFSKSAKFGKDLYKDLVLPNLGYALHVETWRHGDSEPSVCENGKPLVVNVQFIHFKELAVTFSSFQDHSKWASTIPKESANEEGKMWICLGDINRMYSQFHRGGGTMCIQNNIIWKAFSNLITQVEKCGADVDDDVHVESAQIHSEL
ncbi:unnamed protein product [Echinostoma caproni]|uniref:Deoxyribonuclease II n=1 Tax=Echinostoma caproni TaxID=27848 RepID=A0A183AM94_9TREM|nr:unnamed protein product [Echinostoma caproni]